ncbi:MAG: CoA transferase [Chloroflexi bacterium]|nr:CoA transferase [Chloroflexota bacterium]
MDKLPLEGIRVLDICPMFAGNFGTAILADLGAEVIKVESTQNWLYGARGIRARPTKEEVLRASPFWGYPRSDPGPDPWNRSSGFHAFNRNKLSMTVNLRQPAGVEIFKRLIKVADVLVESNSPPLMTRLGIDYPVLREVNTALIMVRSSGYGLSGPYRDRPALAMALEAFSGHGLLRGYPDVSPSNIHGSDISDGCAGAGIALATLMALHHRKRTGQGQLVEMAQVENFMPLLGWFFMDYIFNKRLHSPLGDRHPSAAPCGCYPCAGADEWVNITVHDDEEWEGFCRALGNPDWALDPELATIVGRYRKQDEMDRRILEWTRVRDCYDIVHLMQKEGVPCGPVLSSKNVFEAPQLLAREHFEEVTAPGGWSYLFPGSPLRMSGYGHLRVRYPAPNLGQHNEYVYKELLGYTDEEYARLEREGHIGLEPAPHIP